MIGLIKFLSCLFKKFDILGSQFFDCLSVIFVVREIIKGKCIDYVVLDFLINVFIE